MLTADEKQYVIGIFTQYLAKQTFMRSVAVSFLPFDLRPRLPDGSIALTIAQDTIEICMADGWTRKPTALELLLTSFVVSDSKIKEIVERLKVPPPPVADPLLAMVLETGSPFIDRDELRKSLRGFGDVGSLRPIMVVNGMPKSGRSYTRELLEHFCNRTEFVPCHVQQATGTEPEHVARDLVTYVGGKLTDMPLRETTNEERWLQDLANWVLTQAVDAARQAHQTRKFWFILDGFGGTDMKKSVRDFIVHLANKITTGIYIRDFRLVLLEFERATLTVPVGRIVMDETKEVSDNEIVNCVNSILATSNKVTEAERPAFATQVLQDLPTGEDRMPTLNQRLQTLLEVVGD